MNRLLLIDGSYYVYRSFFAMSHLCSPRGEPSGAIYGFFKAVEKMLRHVQPTHAAVVWDGYPKRRHALQPGYKAHREGRCEDMIAQWNVIHTLVLMMGLKAVCDPDAESDDLMASYAAIGADANDTGYETILATADKDLLACVDKWTRVYSTSKEDKGEGEYALLGESEVITKWGVSPSKLGEVLALMGDGSDNIKGVRGIGEKTAADMIRTYGNARELIAKLEAGEIPKLSAKLKLILPAKELIIQNLEMVRLEIDLPLPLPLESLTVGERTAEFNEAMSYYAINTI